MFDQGTLHLSCADWDLQLGWSGLADDQVTAVAEPGSLSAPMPGKVVAISVTLGQRVALGDPLLVLEAMKMEHLICAPQAGVVDALPFAIGDAVAQGAALLHIAALDPGINSKEEG